MQRPEPPIFVEGNSDDDIITHIKGSTLQRLTARDKEPLDRILTDMTAHADRVVAGYRWPSGWVGIKRDDLKAWIDTLRALTLRFELAQSEGETVHPGAALLPDLLAALQTMTGWWRLSTIATAMHSLGEQSEYNKALNAANKVLRQQED